MMGSFSRLAKENQVDDAMRGLITVAGTAIKELYELVMERHDISGGVADRLIVFWTTGKYIEKATAAKERVQKALDALMLWSVRNPQSSILNPQPSTPNSLPSASTLTPTFHPRAINPHNSTLIPQPSSASRQKRSRMYIRCWTPRTASP